MGPAEPAVEGAVSPLRLGCLTKAQEWLLTPPSLARLASPGISAPATRPLSFLRSTIMKHSFEGLRQHELSIIQDTWTPCLQVAASSLCGGPGFLVGAHASTAPLHSDTTRQGGPAWERMGFRFCSSFIVSSAACSVI